MTDQPKQQPPKPVPPRSPHPYWFPIGLSIPIQVGAEKPEPVSTVKRIQLEMQVQIQVQRVRLANGLSYLVNIDNNIT